MALIQCPECSTQISDKAVACPSCGLPIPSSGISTQSQMEQVPEQSRHYAAPIQTVSVVKTAKSRGTYIILGLFFGLFGIHNFYAGYFGRGAAQLLIFMIFCWIIIGFIIVVPWVLIELFVVTKDASGDKMV